MHDQLDIPAPGQGTITGGRYASSRGDSRLDPGTRNILIFVAGAVLVVGVIAGGMSALSPSHTGVPVVEASTKPLRERPPAQAKDQTTGQTAALTNETDGKPFVTAAPEAPALAALKTTEAPAPLPTPAPIQPLPAPAPAPQASLQATPAPLPPPINQPAKPIPQTAAQPLPAPSAAQPAPHPQPAPKLAGTAVQLAAVGTQEAAMAEWQRLAKRYPDLLANHHPVISRTEHDGKTFWRLRTSGFTDVASATTFCTQFKSRGAHCALASF